jgi:hypothetical protein
MQPILIDGAKFEFQGLIETSDNIFVALHGAAPINENLLFWPKSRNILNYATSGLEQKNFANREKERGAQSLHYVFAPLCDSAFRSGPAIRTSIIEAALTAFAALLDPDEFGASLSQRERANVG